ncbi:hypothetical protein L198_00186 [Cryptococcus wingfieldii CBS 7118]|uniref:Yeast cell wall synthesis Kre9/Knh1-like N-terminal domain-containing protein n=1 Tax=Cryptococcus wingfieldii CBS 7118 TaxID=1295528 RepID=A0A1E3K692_9TREE|nr:hypothetical protein L198_00186 [Cryptococcus wingfieldii CBS 7118]ODO08456.1 hypothetical protein L198_00186 [Cryptococcus wingfieldii CBS 7118]
MHPTTVLATLLATLAVSNALQVTSPTEDDVWSSSGSQTISWDSVSTDPDTFVIELVESGGQNGVTIVRNQTSSENSVTVSYPDGDWPTGTAFQINLLSARSAILAQSDQFNITESASSSSSSSSESSSSSSSSSASSSSSSASSSSSSAAVTSTSAAASSSGASSAAAGSSTSGSIPNSSAAASSASSGSALTSSVAIGSIALAFVGALSVIA